MYLSIYVHNDEQSFTLDRVLNNKKSSARVTLYSTFFQCLNVIEKSAQKMYQKYPGPQQKITPQRHPKRFFSLALPRRLLPKGGHVKLLHLAKHKVSNTVRNSYCKQHDYTTNIHWFETYITIQMIANSR